MTDEPPVKCGLEIHQQLDTGKLFCRCPTEMDETIDVEIQRTLRPTQSEMGEVDAAALAEARKGRAFHYDASHETSCLVEADEEPPGNLNRAALDVALTVALMTEARAMDEVHTMRKIVIDGSNTTGFQRTSLVALGGHVETSQGDVGLMAMALEEDAARIVSRGTREAHYRLDRLGFPLIEIATEPVLHSGEHAKEAALALGTLIRATGKAKRGLGTIRQDLNISTPVGARVEVKGVQELDMIPTFVDGERERQETLAALADDLAEAADPSDLPEGPEDVTDLFEATDSKVLRGVLGEGGEIWALALPGFAGRLGVKGEDEHRLGWELAGYARTQGASGLFHTDELPAYGITADEVAAVHDELGTTADQDAFCLVAADRDVARRSLEAALDRAHLAFEGVPEETRQALEDGRTRYLRPLPGGARMYPETDVPPIRVTSEHLEDLASDLPEMPDERSARYQDELGLPEEMAETLAHGQSFLLFEALVEASGLAKEAARVLLQTRPEIESDHEDLEVSDEVVEDALVALSEDAFAKEALPEIMATMAQEGCTVEQAIEAIGAGMVGEDEVREVIQGIVERNQELIEERQMGAMGALMGEAMGQLKGKADGELISQVMREEIQRALQ